MKNLFLAVCLLGGIAFLSSCSKERTCTCTATDGTVTTTTYDTSKTTAEAACALLAIGDLTCVLD